MGRIPGPSEDAPTAQRHAVCAQVPARSLWCHMTGPCQRAFGKHVETRLRDGGTLLLNKLEHLPVNLAIGILGSQHSVCG